MIRTHVAEMQYANIQGAIVSWWGQGSYEDKDFAWILALSDQGGTTNFEWMLYYELEGTGNPSISQISSDLSYVKAKYASSPHYFKINGEFVVFVYADANDDCGMADRWKQANSVGAYIVLKVFSGYRSCSSQPDGWHQYAPAVAEDSQTPFSFTISPGFWKVGESPRLARDIARWRMSIYDMIMSNALFQLITTFNEWGEGTAVESASEWSTVSGHGEYLEALHLNGRDIPEYPVIYPILLVPLVLSLILIERRRLDRSSHIVTDKELWAAILKC